MKYLKRISALLTAVALIFSLVLPASAAETNITISTLEDFLSFSEQCTKDTWSYGITVELVSDIDLSGQDFTPIPIFQGVFHGNGYTISGISFDKKGSKVGLFRTLTSSASVADLTVEGTLSPQGSASSIGLLAGENYGTINRCCAKGTVNGQEDTGGIVGLNGEEGQISDCSSSVSLTGVINTGGISGRNLGLIEHCSNLGSINIQADQETPSCVGGITGLSRGTIRGCINEGAVGYRHVGYNMGGIAGLQSGEISDCANTAYVRGRKDIGGIVGQFEPSVKLTYGNSPFEQLSESLSSLLKSMELFSDQVNGMASRGINDAEDLNASLQSIKDRVQYAGSEGKEDFSVMSDSLFQYCTDMNANLNTLLESLSRFANDSNEDLENALIHANNLLESLDALLDIDNDLKSDISSFENTVAEIRFSLETANTHSQAMQKELRELKQYIDEVIQLISSGEFQEALKLPLPSLNPVGHIKSILSAFNEISELSSKLPEQWETIRDKAGQALNQSERDIENALDGLYNSAGSLLRSARDFSYSSGKSAGELSRSADLIQKLLKEYTDLLADKAQSAADDIGNRLSDINSILNDMTISAEADNEALYNTSQQVLNEFDNIRKAIAELGKEPELVVTDLSDQVDCGPGLVSGCNVSGLVEGDTNTGGIVGSVSTELSNDPEATFDPGDLELMSDVYAELRAVIRNCRFDGDVISKNECSGGIAGRCAAGSIIDCSARGTVSTDEDYCGGIAGRTNGKIIRCACLIDISGDSWLGGIAGLGNDISCCRAMVTCQSEGEYLGAIAGQAEGTLTGNRYLDEDLAGLDGVDCLDSAQGLGFEDFSLLEYIPEDFLTFSYRFVANGETVAEIPFSYGGDLDVSLIPQTPEQNGEYGQWPSFPTENLRRSMILEAQFIAPLSTLADREGIARFLVEGSFSPDASLSVQEEDPEKQKVNGADTVSAWSYDVSGSKSDSVTIRLRTDGAENPAAAILLNGTWEKADSVLDGNYLVFTAPAQGRVMLLDDSKPMVLVVGLTGAAAIFAAAFATVTYKKRTLPKGGEKSKATQ